MLKPIKKDWAIVNNVWDVDGELFGSLIRNRLGMDIIITVKTTQQLLQIGLLEDLHMVELTHINVPEDFEENLSALGLANNNLHDDFHRSYKEIKNFIHNDQGVTKNEIYDTLYGIAKQEIKQLLDENHKTLSSIIYSQVKSVMIDVLHNKRVSPYYGRAMLEEKDFMDFIKQAMKDVVADIMKDQFDVSINIQQSHSQTNIKPEEPSIRSKPY